MEATPVIPRKYVLPLGVMFLGWVFLIALLTMTNPIGWVLLPAGALLIVTGGVGALILRRLETGTLPVGVLMYSLSMLAVLGGVCGAAIWQILSGTS